MRFIVGMLNSSNAELVPNECTECGFRPLEGGVNALAAGGDFLRRFTPVLLIADHRETRDAPEVG